MNKINVSRNQGGVRMEFQVGMNVEWKTWGGDKYEGIITEIEDDEVHVRCTDGKERAVNNPN